LFDTVPPFSSVEHASVAAKVLGTIFVILDQPNPGLVDRARVSLQGLADRHRLDACSAPIV
jgi:hypothetical protein